MFNRHNIIGEHISSNRPSFDENGNPLVYIDLLYPNKIFCPALSEKEIEYIQRRWECSDTECASPISNNIDETKWELDIHQKATNSADPETIRVCNSQGDRCFFNPGRYCYRTKDPLGDNEEFLFPYRKYRRDRTKTWFDLNIAGSALVAAWKQIFVIYTIDVILSLFLIFEIIPSSIFPVNGDAFSTIFTVFNFLIGVYYGISLSKYRSVFDEFLINVLGNIQNTALNMHGMIDETKAGVYIESFIHDPKNMTIKAVRSTVWCHILDINYILKALPYAIKHIYRSEETFNPLLLPMEPNLIDELMYRGYLGSNYIDALRGMYTERLGRLIHLNVITPNATGNLLEKSDNFGLVTGSIGRLLSRDSKIPRIMTNLMLVALWTYSIWLTFDLYEYWAIQVHLVLYYIVLFIVLVFILGIFTAADRIGNPFSNPEQSNYTFYDLGKIANDSARNVDAQFNAIRAYLIAVNISKYVSRLKQ